MEKLEKYIKKRSSIRDALKKLSLNLDKLIVSEVKNIGYFVDLLEQLNANDSSLNLLNAKTLAAFSYPINVK